MSSRRVLKVAEAVREVVAMAIITDLRDPRIQNVTVTFVEVSGDLRLAKVHISVMGDETTQNLSLKGLQNASGYLQQKISNRVDLRYTPTLRFVLDKGIKNAFEVTRILEDILPEEQAEADQADDSGTGTADEEQSPANESDKNSNTKDEAEEQAS